MRYDDDIEAALADFGVDALLNDTQTIQGIFDNDYTEALEMAATEPHFICKSSDVTKVRRDDRLRIGAESYRVVNLEPDGTGVSVIRLTKG